MIDCNSCKKSVCPGELSKRYRCLDCESKTVDHLRREIKKMEEAAEFHRALSVGDLVDGLCIRIVDGSIMLNYYNHEIDEVKLPVSAPDDEPPCS